MAFHEWMHVGDAEKEYKYVGKRGATTIDYVIGRLARDEKICSGWENCEPSLHLPLKVELEGKHIREKEAPENDKDDNCMGQKNRRKHT